MCVCGGTWPPGKQGLCLEVLCVCGPRKQGLCLGVLCVLSRNSSVASFPFFPRCFILGGFVLYSSSENTLPQRMVLYSYSENGNAQQVPSFLVSFFSDFMSTLYRLSLSLSDYLLSFLVHARFHARFHACPLPPSLCLFPGKVFMSMLPAVPEKFKRRAVFLRVLMR